MTITIRPLRAADLPEADRVFRLAFGTFLGLPDPLSFAGDSDWTATRWRHDPGAAFAAEMEGEFVGSNFATMWGTVGFFGPLTVRPDLWDRGIAHRLLEPTMDCFAARGTTLTGLFTFAQSAKHVALYQRFGFYPRFLTAVMSKTIGRVPAEALRNVATAAARDTDTAAASETVSARYGLLSATERERCLADGRELTGSLYGGLDLTTAIRDVDAQKLGDTVFVSDDDRVIGLALCHVGAGSEAGSGTCYVKFGAVRPGATASRHFERLLDACESYARQRGARAVEAGINLAREPAYRAMLARGYRTVLQGVAMHRPNEPGYSRPDVFALDDWR